jgi:hypothetical protein
MNVAQGFTKGQGGSKKLNPEELMIFWTLVPALQGAVFIKAVHPKIKGITAPLGDGRSLVAVPLHMLAFLEPLSFWVVMSCVRALHWSLC